MVEMQYATTFDGFFFCCLNGTRRARQASRRSCHSRHEFTSYRRNAGRKPSPHLVAKLRLHETLQRRCGPGTAAYSAAVEQLRSGKSHGGAIGSPECRYLVSISYQGLGNRILAAASAFLYAVLTDRVLLVDPSNEMGELFCEPFPGTTWLLPPDFPLTSYTNFSIDTAESYGNMLKSKVIGGASASRCASSAASRAQENMHVRTPVPEPPCGRDVSMEPCFHNPAFYDCRTKRGADTGACPALQRRELGVETS
jgi:hypothetical protein